MDHFLWNLKQVRLKDKLVLVSGIPLNPRKPETWEIKGINPFDSAESGRQAGIRGKSAPESAESGRYEEIRGINPSNSAESGRYEEIRGINPSDSAESGRYEEIKGINPSNSAESGRYEEIKGINPSADFAGRWPKARMSGKSVPDFTGGCPKQSSQNRAM
ncbi:hypothetical protein [Paenibacillus phytohabitans]|uniref:hypothetical protein n=1 Tax=Paenibacillus phytohabitans TaxID=2654978 RepID=UPI00300A0FB2